MRTSGAACWALQLLACFTLGLAAPRSHYCERADVAWRAYRAPAAFEARVQSLAGDRLATLQVRRVLRRQGGWPRRHAVLRLRLPPTDKDACTGRFEVPLKNRQNYIIFAERAGHMAVALGPPLRRTRKLLRRIRAVYAPGYSECLSASECRGHAELAGTWRKIEDFQGRGDPLERRSPRSQVA
ncbi:unnamed protein product [Plutella xylostella]|uniref:(diamondback moth) hypothetical protein n=1 Tax=Plutella xylostella TaxID=51655 RepID=A0A8S4EK13_PLUXY|nr:unnamed protein product [Plutella xylostella]